MNNTMLLTLISLLLGLIGTFTKTSKDDKDGNKKVTAWGYCLAVLLIVSTTTAIINQIENQKTNKINEEKQKEEVNQQRLLSLIAISSNFEIENNPYLNFAFYEQYNEKGELRDSAKSSLYYQFPSFGIKDTKYVLEIKFLMRSMILYPVIAWRNLKMAQMICNRKKKI